MMDLRIKSCNMHVQSLRTDGVFNGYASVFDVEDAHGDVVCKGAFLKTLIHWRQKKEWPKMLWQHQSNQVIGIWTHMHEDEKGLYVEGRLLLDIEKAREVYALMKARAIDRMSIGFYPKKVMQGDRAGRSVMYVREVDLMEISLVTFAANNAACVLDVKYDRAQRRQYDVKRGGWYDMMQDGQYDIKQEKWLMRENAHACTPRVDGLNSFLNF